MLHGVTVESYIVWNQFYCSAASSIEIGEGYGVSFVFESWSYLGLLTMVALNQSYKKIQLEIVCTSLICDTPVVVYFNSDQNRCNHILPATEEIKKD